MPDADDILDDIVEDAAKPAKASFDGNSVEQHKLADRLAILDRVAAQNAASSPRRGIRLTKLIPPGAD